MATAKRRKPKYKSGLELTVSKLLPKSAQYEPDRIPYTVVHNYCPDFKLGPNNYIEAKGKFVASDRAKHLYIQKQHPEIKVRFVFGRSSNKLNKASKTSYADWCDKNGFEWTDISEGIPKEWLKPNENQ